MTPDPVEQDEQSAAALDELEVLTMLLESRVDLDDADPD